MVESRSAGATRTVIAPFCAMRGATGRSRPAGGASGIAAATAAALSAAAYVTSAAAELAGAASLTAAAELSAAAAVVPAALPRAAWSASSSCPAPRPAIRPMAISAATPRQASSTRVPRGPRGPVAAQAAEYRIHCRPSSFTGSPSGFPWRLGRLVGPDGSR